MDNGELSDSEMMSGNHNWRDKCPGWKTINGHERTTRDMEHREVDMKQAAIKHDTCRLGCVEIFGDFCWASMGEAAV